MRLVDVTKIWDQAPHNAFTDLARWNGQWYCVFREGEKHVSNDGALRVLASPDGKVWTSVGHMTHPTADLRDAKITVTPDNRLMLSGAGALHQPADARHRSLAWFSSDGHTWTEPAQIGDDNMWLWRITWHKDVAYCTAQATIPDRNIRLYASPNGVTYSVVADRMQQKSFPNESTLQFLADDTALCLLRRDAEPFSALLGSAHPPYTTWTWLDLGKRIGGPNFIALTDGRFVAGVRLYDERQRTSLCWLDPQRGTLVEALTLPSGGDTSYCGLVWHEGLLWVSYYSSHEEKTSIYLARVEVS
jgi:hypothetical protein